MKSHGVCRRSVAVLSLILSAAAIGKSAPVEAGSGFNQFAWGAPGITLHTNSYQYSNMTGFWQSVLNSNGCPVGVDGIFGNVTKWHSALFQNAMTWEMEGYSYNNGGEMTPWWLNYFQNATSVYGPRLNYLSTDGYGSARYSYYGGYDSPVSLAWNPIVGQWFFAQYPASSPLAFTAATPSRTIGSAGACA